MLLLNKPVVGITSHVATPKTVLPQDIHINVNHPQHTMRFRKCHGFAEPVDVTKTQHARLSAPSNGVSDSMRHRRAGVDNYS